MPPIGGVKQTIGNDNLTYSGNCPKWTQLGRNKRAVWTINTRGYPDAHYAVFPESLVEIPLKATCPEFICKRCRLPRWKIYKAGDFIATGGKRKKETPGISEQQKEGSGYHQKMYSGYSDCGCNAGWDVGIVLDPFVGSGTTMQVAQNQNKNSIGIDINPSSIKFVKNRLLPFTTQKKVLTNEPIATLEIIKYSI